MGNGRKILWIHSRSLKSIGSNIGTCHQLLQLLRVPLIRHLRLRPGGLGPRLLQWLRLLTLPGRQWFRRVLEGIVGELLLPRKGALVSVRPGSDLVMARPPGSRATGWRRMATVTTLAL
jgi:hypothetical protein